ncbi:hypothetical protein QTP88_021366 [Uroleucon formosanum]
MSKVIFLPEHEEILIESVRKNPILYDSADSKHKDIILKDEIWKDIGLKIGKSGDECKKRWKNIRDTYNRNKRKLGTGSARTSKKKWPLAAHISFLDGVECERSSSSNATMIDESFSHEEDEESIEEAIQEEKTANTNEGFSYAGQRIRSNKDKMAVMLAKRTAERKQLLEKIQKQNEDILNAKNSEDGVDLFFKSLAMTVKKLPPKGIIEAKLKALTMVSELEEKYSYCTTPQQHAITYPTQQLHVFDDNYIQPSTPSSSYTASDSSQGYTTYNFE